MSKPSCCFFIIVALLGFHEARAQSTEIIRNINIDRRDIFDTLGINWIERLGNSLHEKTREEIVRRELLFKEGDTLNSDLVDETARNLRKLTCLATADVNETHIGDSLVDLDVVTRDRWSLYVTPWLSNDGGITNAILSVGESNFRGMGQSLNASVNYLSSRKRPWGTEFDFNEPRTFGSEVSTFLTYRNSEDLIQTAVSLVKPFYTEEETWSAGMYADGGTVKSLLYASGVITAERFFNFQSQNVWGIYSFNHDEDKLRLGSAFTRERYGHDSLFNSISQQVTLLNISVAWMTREYIRETYFDDLGRIEDVPIGFSSSAVFGKDIMSPKLYYILYQDELVQEIFGTYLSGLAGIQGYDDDSHLKDATVSLSVTGAGRTGTTSSIVASASGTYGIDWSNGRQLYLDSPDRLRGIPSFDLTGDRRFTINIERRFGNRIRWKFFTIGSVLFADGGMIWSQGQEYTSARFYKSVGYGIRIQNERLLGGTILRLDFAYNVDMKNFEFIISTNQLFSAFGGVDTAPPSSFQ